MLFSPEADREEHREAEVREETGDLQVHEMRQGLPVGDVAAKAPEAGVRRRAQTRVSDMRQEVHVQIHADPSPGVMQEEASVLRDGLDRSRVSLGGTTKTTLRNHKMNHGLTRVYFGVKTRDTFERDCIGDPRS